MTVANMMQGSYCHWEISYVRLTSGEACGSQGDCNFGWNAIVQPPLAEGSEVSSNGCWQVVLTYVG